MKRIDINSNYGENTYVFLTDFTYYCVIKTQIQMIIYYAKEGQSLVDLCHEIQLENPEYLRDYHHQNCSLSERFEDDLTPGMKLYIPSSPKFLSSTKKSETKIKAFMISQLKENSLLTLNFGRESFKLLRLPILTIQSLQSMRTKSNYILKELKMDIIIFSFQHLISEKMRILQIPKWIPLQKCV